MKYQRNIDPLLRGEFIVIVYCICIRIYHRKLTSNLGAVILSDVIHLGYA